MTQPQVPGVLTYCSVPYPSVSFYLYTRQDRYEEIEVGYTTLNYGSSIQVFLVRELVGPKRVNSKSRSHDEQSTYPFNEYKSESNQ